VAVGHEGAEVSVGFLFFDPGEEGLELGGFSQGVEGSEFFIQAFVGVGGVELFVAGFAQRGAVLGFAASLFGLEVVLGDEVVGDLALAEGAGLPVGVRGHGRILGGRQNFQHPTSNIQHPTSNVQPFGKLRAGFSTSKERQKATSNIQHRTSKFNQRWGRGT
jgi:hypothetical protein